jgi:hypothetical protein
VRQAITTLLRNLKTLYAQAYIHLDIFGGGFLSKERYISQF